MRTLCRRFVRDTGGVAAIIFGLSLPPLMMIVGAAIDYSRATAAKDRLDAIADMTILHGVSHGAVEAMRWLPDYGQAKIKAAFEAQAATVADVTLGNVEVLIQQTNVQRDVTLNYNWTLKNYFASFVSGPSTALGCSRMASTSMPVFIDFYLM